MHIIQALILIVMAYLLGSISFAIVAAKIFNFSDPRKTGSNNPGTTNVLRIAGKKAALFVILCDLIKGMIPIFIAKVFGVPLFFQGLIGFFAVLGHILPIYHTFVGGKGVATTIGVLYALNIGLGLAASLTWLIVALLFRYSSLASIVMAITLPGYAFWLKLNPLVPTLLLLSGTLLICHRGNIKRLMLRKEPKIGKKSELN